MALTTTVLLSHSNIKIYQTFMFDVVPSPGSGGQSIQGWLSLSSLCSFFILRFPYLVSQVSGIKESKVSTLSAS